MKQKQVPFKLRLHPKLLKKIIKKAKTDDISVNQEAVKRIELSFLYEGIFGVIDKFSLNLDRRFWAVSVSLQNIHNILSNETDARSRQKSSGIQAPARETVTSP